MVGPFPRLDNSNYQNQTYEVITNNIPNLQNDNFNPNSKTCAANSNNLAQSSHDVHQKKANALNNQLCGATSQ